MCDFISWKEFDGHVYFLDDIALNTKVGEKFVAYLGDQYEIDIKGHGAIDFYYPELKGKGIKKECIDFSSPANFPEKIVEAIKKGTLSLIGINLNLLNKKGNNKYWADRKPLSDKYEADKKLLYVKYRADIKPLVDKYEADIKTLVDKYEADKRQLFWKLFKQKEYRNPIWN